MAPTCLRAPGAVFFGRLFMICTEQHAEVLLVSDKAAVSCHTGVLARLMAFSLLATVTSLDGAGLPAVNDCGAVARVPKSTYPPMVACAAFGSVRLPSAARSGDYSHLHLKEAQGKHLTQVSEFRSAKIIVCAEVL